MLQMGIPDKYHIFIMPAEPDPLEKGVTLLMLICDNNLYSDGGTSIKNTIQMKDPH